MTRTKLLLLLSAIGLFIAGCEPTTTKGNDPADCSIDDSNAPKWALLQREVMCKSQEIIHWKIENDQTEMMEEWLPAILGTDDSLTRQAWSQKADEIWYSGQLFRAYSKEVGNVEDVSGLFNHTHSIVQLIEYGEPRFVERAMANMKNFRNTWTGKTAQGHLHMKSSRFSATEMTEESPYGVDVPMNAKAISAARWAGWYNQNPQIIDLFTQWGKAWVSEANRSDNGKPKGIIPAAVSFPEGKIGGYGGTWYQPGLSVSHDWENLGGVAEMYNQLMGMYQITGNETFLEPISQTYALVASNASDEEKQKAGSAAWAGELLRTNPAGIQIFELAKNVSGKTDYDEFLGASGSSYSAYQINGDLSGIEGELESALNNLKQFSADGSSASVSLEGNQTLLGMYSGSREMALPSLAVSWENTGIDVGILVNYGSSDSLNVNLYNFGGEKEISMNLWKLEAGTYQLILKNKDGFTVGDRSLVIIERGQKESIELPDNQELTLTISQQATSNINKKTSPDLAIGIGDVGITPKPISGSDSVDLNVIIHNIGNAAATNIEVKTWVDGKPLGTTMIDKIDAPNDLSAKTHRVRLAWRNEKGAHDFLVIIKCDQQEITMRNNEFEMHMEEIVLHGR